MFATVRFLSEVRETTTLDGEKVTLITHRATSPVKVPVGMMLKLPARVTGVESTSDVTIDKVGSELFFCVWPSKPVCNLPTEEEGLWESIQSEKH